MNMSKWTKWLIGGVAGLFLAAVGLGLGTAIAVASESTAAKLADPGLDALGWPHGLVDMQALLAEELARPQQAAREAAIQQLVDAGILTEEQGELAIAAAALRSYLDRHDMRAEALGITPEQLTAARVEEKTLADLLVEQDMSLATFQENLAKAHEEALAQAIEDGVITQEQLDQLQVRIPGRMQGGFGHGRHGLGGAGSFFGEGPLGPPDN